jgi:hypothetical protein
MDERPPRRLKRRARQARGEVSRKDQEDSAASARSALKTGSASFASSARSCQDADTVLCRKRERTMADAEKAYLPAAGHDWALPLYDPFVRLAGGEPTRLALI